MDSPLSYLLHPLTIEDFFSEYWEQKPLKISRNKKEYYKDLLSLNDLDYLISSKLLVYPFLRLVKNGTELQPREYMDFIDNSHMGTYAGSDPTINPPNIYANYEAGSTIVFDSLDQYWKPLSVLCRALEKYFNFETKATVFLTPNNAQGFSTHYDTQENFILQVVGEKRWRVYEPAIKLPHGKQGYELSSHSSTLYDDITLTQGDLLYLPRGFVHDVSTFDNSNSLHIAVGITTYTWIEVLSNALPLLAQNLSFRKSLPVGFINNLNLDILKREFDSLILSLTDKKEFDNILDKTIEHFISNRPVHLDGQLEQLANLKILTSSSVLKHRDNIICKLNEANGKAKLFVDGKQLIFPSQTYGALHFITQTNEFNISEIPYLTNSSQITIARRLIKEGVLVITQV